MLSPCCRRRRRDAASAAQLGKSLALKSRARCLNWRRKHPLLDRAAPAPARATKMTELWTPSMFQKLFDLVAKSDRGVLGAMAGRERCVSFSEFVGFMKANRYQTLGLTITDLADAFKFANNTGGCIRPLQVEESGGEGLVLRHGAEADKSEMSEEEFWQCLMFVQARFAALHSDPVVTVLPTRAPFEYNNRGVQQLGRFMQELCGKTINVRLGDKQTESLQLSKAAAQPGADAAQQPSKKKARPQGQPPPSLADGSAPLTDMEKKRVYVWG
jgi:hypothetical protein